MPPAALGSTSFSSVKSKTVKTKESPDSNPSSPKTTQKPPATLKASLPAPLKATLPAALSATQILGPGPSSAPTPLHGSPRTSTLQEHVNTGDFKVLIYPLEHFLYIFMQLSSLGGLLLWVLTLHDVWRHRKVVTVLQRCWPNVSQVSWVCAQTQVRFPTWRACVWSPDWNRKKRSQKRGWRKKKKTEKV